MTTRIGIGAKVYGPLENQDKKPKDRTKAKRNPKAKYKKRRKK